MPNHCFNRVNIYNNNTNNDSSITKLHKIFSSNNETESIFGKLIPEPEWSKVPLTEEDAKDRGEVGELPVWSEDRLGGYFTFSSTGSQDNRWYDWRIDNWGTKWDCYSLKMVDSEMPHSFTVEFDTAWAPPEEIFYAITEKFDSDLSVSWFYDEPGCEIAGYLGND